MKTEYRVEYHDGHGWVRFNADRTKFHKLVGFARREAKKLTTDYPGTKTRILKTSLSFIT